MSLDGDELVVRFVWNSMPRPDAQIATVAFAGGPERPWPRGAGLSSAWSQALTVWGTGAALTAADGGERSVPARSGDHLTEARVPLSSLPAGPWRIAAGSGLADPADPGRYWAVPAGDASDSQPGSGGPASPTNVWDLVLVGDKPWSFDERRQADLLATGSAADGSFAVDPQLMRSGRDAAGRGRHRRPVAHVRQPAGRAGRDREGTGPDPAARAGGLHPARARRAGSTRRGT